MVANRGRGRADRFEIVLAAVEACSNAVGHPVGRASGTIYVRGKIDTNVVMLTVADDGVWRRADRSRVGGGHGLALMEALMSDLRIKRSACGTRVSLSRQLL